MRKIGDLKSFRARYGVVMPFNGFAEGGFGGFKRYELADSEQEIVVRCDVEDVSDKLSVGGIADDVESFGVKCEVFVGFVYFSGFELEWRGGVREGAAELGGLSNVRVNFVVVEESEE